MSDSYDLTDVEAFTAVAIGIPGARTFYLQVRTPHHQQLAFKCEEQHVEALAGALASLLGEHPSRRHDASGAIAGDFPVPDHADWVVGSIALGVDEGEQRILVVLEEATDDDDGAQARFGMSYEQAQAFVDHGTQLVRAGRPGCTLCGSPIDTLGYHCTCFN